MEYPKRYTSTNEITGDLIKSKGDNRDRYAQGWDKVFNSCPEEAPEQPTEPLNVVVDSSLAVDSENVSKDVLRGNDGH